MGYQAIMLEISLKQPTKLGNGQKETVIEASLEVKLLTFGKLQQVVHKKDVREEEMSKRYAVSSKCCFFQLFCTPGWSKGRLGKAVLDAEV